VSRVGLGLEREDYVGRTGSLCLKDLAVGQTYRSSTATVDLIFCFFSLEYPPPKADAIFNYGFL
jgi:hypothetical protein